MDKRINALMFVTSVRPLINSVRISGTYNKVQRIAEILDNGSTPRAGDLINLSGYIVKGAHRKVLNADKWQLNQITYTNVIEFIKRSSHFQKILNQQQFKAIHNAYNEIPKRLIAVMAGYKPDELKQVLGCSVTAANMQYLWRKKSYEVKAVNHLELLGINTSEALEIISMFSSDTIKKVEDNPYILISVIGFERADHIARKKGIDLFEPKRLSALGQWFCVNHSIKSGSSLFEQHAIEKIALEHGVDAYSIIYESKRSGIFLTKDKWFTSSANHFIETSIRKFLTQVERRKSIHFHDYEIDNEIDIFNAQSKNRLHTKQEMAVRLAIHHPITCVQGAAGVGKTEVINAISCINKRLLGTDVIGTALSAIAVDRIKQATKIKSCFTIAKIKVDLLSKKLKIEPGSILIVDESSMLSIQDLYSLSSLCIFDIRIIFIGDLNQLPPIGYGAFFHQATSYFPTTILTKVWRTESEEITNAANIILKGQKPNEAEEFSYFSNDMAKVASYAIDENAQVIAATNATVNKINSLIQTKKKSILSEVSFTILGTPFIPGDRVIFTNNVNKLNIFNGQFATLKWFKNNDFVFEVQSINSTTKEITLSYEEVVRAGIQLGYAVTCHKAQGAEFNKVVVVLENLPMCNKNWAYTAITRAKIEVKIVEVTPLETVLKQPIQSRITQQVVPVLI